MKRWPTTALRDLSLMIQPRTRPLTPTLSPKGEREKQTHARANSLSPLRGEGQGEGFAIKCPRAKK